MNRHILSVLAVLTMFALPALAEARCFSFRGKDIKVCVEGSDGDARRQATSVCEDVTGDSSCRISGDSGECRRSSSVRCYDANGDEQSHIDPD
ncbi:MAG TPA: hypothetical protein RMH85_05840 [Polyangiaceae bacterium LLY-WYZ-15_(1-7)]|nr:hypothetical protein [Polyangiaceae bacterium LLY-WYZ-15_(1-7)]HJL01735.1 hypothetical protein [Polyangiaceae bacterium LLY-WYZ-15_(1-7)]HJL07997.1 hypothetical protein [Polyangiaceae bacterium LLY-WYZ-15_(1-7)]HJL32962.1 hypothetical protein [Polyangiaceae bacterium LLY-WYZ-15_(1-7)]HJL37817.1 hypothetical protein [Polyangiaceae bacterium LLY-WYZ-15_(1-7)]